MPLRPSSSGRPTYIILSIRPGLVRAASNTSGRLVAPTTTTRPPRAPPPEEPTPSNSVSSWLNSRSPPPPPPESPLLDAIASISSKKITDGAASLALRNRPASARSLSPSHLLSSSGPFTAKKFMLPSVAMARAMRVLEHPGGPYNSMPFGGGTDIISNRRGCVRGSSMDSRRSALTSRMPPMALHGTAGTSTATERMAEGLVVRMARSRSARVMSMMPGDADGDDGVVVAVRERAILMASFTASLQSAPVNPFARRASFPISQSSSTTAAPSRPTFAAIIVMLAGNRER
mmetsp:Transcript_9730/g.23818  ORF Transcript_9730/g.23818 Transcript_9730/m.23818 type:complete len:290 (-) Transcript_9730:312-1181(-)